MSAKNNIKKLSVVLVVPNFKWAAWDVNTNWDFIPYNLCLLAAMIEEEHKVTILDANKLELSADAFQQKLITLQPDVVGITVLMDQYGPAGHRAVKLSKECVPTATTVVGGVYATMNWEKLITDVCVDIVVRGEGEYTFKQVLRHLAGSGDMPSAGVVFRNENRVINRNRSPFIQDLDQIPMPSYHLIDFLSYTAKGPRRKSVDIPSVYPYARMGALRVS